MTPLLNIYSQTLTQVYRARDGNRIEEEELLLSKLDRIWIDMSEEERDLLDQVGLETKQIYRMKQQILEQWKRTTFHHAEFFRFDLDTIDPRQKIFMAAA